MKKTNRANIKVTLIVATSKDGYISPADGVTLPSTKWTSQEDHQFFTEKTQEISVMIMGRATYDTIGRPLPRRVIVVLTRDSEKQAAAARRKLKMDYLPNNLRFTSKSPQEVLQALATEGYQQVALCGGASLYQLFTAEDLVDEMFITVEPIEFGDGIKLFKDEQIFTNFQLVQETPLNKQGTIVQHWVRKAD
ncbi:MAG TPA: dihydrofolate reductase family protein [Candidatus Woesebacteria bacterium]|jgi:dihydrofolate reductase|nr:dihydrofolate reductase family protein [Candidatus Woesebacteria bacterium]